MLKILGFLLARFLLDRIGEWESTMPIYRGGDYAEYQVALYAESKQHVPTPASGLETSLFGSDGLTFGDLVDAINPLQHLPIVSTLYRKFTGDDISPAARVAGGGLFGGVIGLATSLASVVIEKATGGDVGDHVLALVTGEETPAPADDAVRIAALAARANAASGSDVPVGDVTRHAAASRGYQAAAAVTTDPTGMIYDLRP
jgi:hypothetical protein